MTALIDARALWRIPAAVSKRNPPTAAKLHRVLGTTPDVIDLSPVGFWHTLRSTSANEETLVAVIGDLLRDKTEEKSLPWYRGRPLINC